MGSRLRPTWRSRTLAGRGSLRLGGAGVVLAQLLGGHRPDVADVDGGETDGEGDPGQHEVIGPLRLGSCRSRHSRRSGRASPARQMGQPSSLPCVGWKAKKYETIGASQKTGIDIPRTERARPATSPNDRGLRPPRRRWGRRRASHDHGGSEHERRRHPERPATGWPRPVASGRRRSRSSRAAGGRGRSGTAASRACSGPSSLATWAICAVVAVLPAMRCAGEAPVKRAMT